MMMMMMMMTFRDEVRRMGPDVSIGIFTHPQPKLVLQLECVRCSINHEGIGLG